MYSVVFQIEWLWNVIGIVLKIPKKLNVVVYLGCKLKLAKIKTILTIFGELILF